MSEPDFVFLMDLVPMDEGVRLGINEWRGIRTKKYTYAKWIDGNDWVLFDNESDPYQLNNLVDNKDMSSIKQDLELELQKWMKWTNDDGLNWRDLITQLGLVDLWNLRERAMHPNNPRLI